MPPTTVFLKKALTFLNCILKYLQMRPQMSWICLKIILFGEEWDKKKESGRDLTTVEYGRHSTPCFLLSEMSYNKRDLNLQWEIFPIATIFINTTYENKEYQHMKNSSHSKTEMTFSYRGSSLFLT